MGAEREIRAIKNGPFQSRLVIYVIVGAHQLPAPDRDWNYRRGLS
jgi:hypothetical protein